MASIFIGIVVSIGLGVITTILSILAVRLQRENERLGRVSMQLEQQNARLAQQLQANDARLRSLERLHREAEDARLHEAQLEQYAQKYREELRNDRRLASLQILNMSWKIEIINIYVQLRLYQEPQGINSRNIPLSLLKAEQTQDPLLILQESRLHMERLAKVSFSPVDAIQQCQHCLIMGDPGAGKTTLLKYLALKSAAGQLSGLPDLPIHIDLNAFASQKQQENLLEFAADGWASYGFPRDEALPYMQKCLREGNALLLLDGLDETIAGTSEVAESSYERVTRAVDQLAVLYPSAYIVVTVRTAGYQQRPFLQHFIEFELLDFSVRDVEQFIDNWFGRRDVEPRPELAKKLQNELRQRQHTRILSLVSNPLLLALVAFLYERRGKLSEKRADLYAECVQLLLSRWDEDKSHYRPRSRRLDLDKEEVKRLLQRVAWHFHLKGQRYFRENDLLAVIEDFLQAVHKTELHAEEVLKDIALANDLLKEQAHGWYGFFHLTIQEYFVALHARDMQQDGFTELRKHVGEAWWEEVILLYAGTVADASQLLQQLIAEYTDGDREEELFRQHLILAGRCVAANPVIAQEPQLRQMIINRLFRELDSTPYTLIRQHTAEALAEIGDEQTHERLLDIFRERERENLLDIQAHVARALSLSSGASKMNELHALISDELIPSRVRGAIVQALGEADIGSAASTLLPLVSNNKIDAQIRLDIANIFGQSIDEHSLDDAMEQLYALFLPVLQNRLPRTIFLADRSRDFEVDLRCSLLESFFTSSIIDTVGGEVRKRLIGLLWELYNNNTVIHNRERNFFSIRWRAAIALAARGEEPALSYPLSVLADKSKYAGYALHVRLTIATALAAIRLPEMKARLIHELLPLLSDEEIDALVRVEITRMLETSGDHTLIPALFPVLQNEDINQDVRIAVAHAFGALGERRHGSMLYRLRIQENIENNRAGEDRAKKMNPLYRSVLIAICRLGVSNVVSKLLPSLADKEVALDERLTIIETLGQLPAPAIKEYAVVSFLMELLLDREVELPVRQAAVAALAQLATDSSTAQQLQPELERLLETDLPLRDEVHRALWTMRYQDAGSSTSRQENTIQF